MIAKLKTIALAHALSGGIALGLALFPADAGANTRPVSRLALDEQIRAVCEASSADLVGKRDERRCRAEWEKKVRELELVHGKGRVAIRVQ